MRNLVIAASILVVAMSCACIIEFPEEPETSESVVLLSESRDDWRRTSDGWGRSATWRKRHDCSFPIEADFAQVHPAALAALQVLLSFGGLVAFSDVTLVQKHPHSD